MALTDTKVRNIKPSLKPLKLFDRDGLFLLVTPTGCKWWRFKYRFGGKEKLLSLGTYPEVSLKDARDRRDELRKAKAANIDPAAQRRASKAAAIDASANSFEVVAREWLIKHAEKWDPETASRKLERLERDVFPGLGERPIAELDARELYVVLMRIESRGAFEIARRVRQIFGQVFRYAMATGRAQRDYSADLKDALTPTKEKHHAALTNPPEVGALLRAIQAFRGELATKAALQLAPLVFVRPGELRAAGWSEFDFDEATWRIPACRMKMEQEHIVPLSRQALAVLRELKQITGGPNRKYVFPSVRSRDRCMSENTVNAALRRLGYTTDEMTGHGFRTIASTLLHDSGLWSSDIIERQLSHQERNKIKDAYNRAAHLPERRRMMQWWADHLDSLRDGAEVVPLLREA